MGGRTAVGRHMNWLLRSHSSARIQWTLGWLLCPHAVRCTSVGKWGRWKSGQTVRQLQSAGVRSGPSSLLLADAHSPLGSLL